MIITKSSVSSFVGDVVSLGAENAENPQVGVSDPSLARFRTLGKGKWLVVFTKDGDGVITVSDGEEKAEIPLSVRPAFANDSEGPFNIYCGDLHCHTSYSDGSLTPYDAFRQVKKERILDFFTISDHAELEDDDEFYHTFDAADSVCADGSLIAFAGNESEIDLVSSNAIGNIQNDGGEIVTVNAEGYSWATSWEQFFDDIGGNPLAFATIAHPQVMGGGIKCIWNAFDPEHSASPASKELIHGIETINEKGESNLVNERAYSLYLDCGYKVSPFSGCDNHSPIFGMKTCTSMTFLYSQKKSKDAFIDSLRSARTYCAENANTYLWFTVNGHAPAATLPITDTYRFDVTVKPYFEEREGDRAVLAEVISDGGSVVASKQIEPGTERFEITVRSDTARYFYLRIFDANDKRTWSCPVFTGREYDKYPKPAFSGTAIPTDGFSVAYCSGGSGAENVLIPDPKCCFVSDKTDAELVIDMGKTFTLSAIGIYSNIVDPTIDESRYFHWSHAPLIAKMVSRYGIETSVDGVNYSPAAGSMIRLYGSEHIAEFERREARYVRFRALASVGADGRDKRYKDSPVSIGTLRFYL